MSQLLASLWPLFALILGGYVLRRTGFPSAEFWPGAERLNYFILFPALLFYSLASAPLDNPGLSRVALCVGLMIGGAWVALLVARRLYRWPAQRFGIFVQGTLRFNTYIGLAAVGALFGEAGLTLMALLLAISVPVVNILSVHALTAQGSVSPRAWLLTLLKNPLILACLLGVLANLSGLRLVGGVDNLLGLLAATSLPLGLLCVGAALQPQDLRGETRALLINSAVRLVLMPLAAWLLVSLLGMPKMESAILVLFFALPCAPTAYVLARQYGGDAHLMAGVITLQTLLAMLALPVLLLLVL
ncbi:AEC family transporter [Pseudomonas sp. MYb185]|uniref:AEC family transporter n=1 Tax=Pseudomonas sp. MYb185 TaxID=1848729 RepID=UPI000CFB6D05|nr:AEC family transporter [Pseudomonas sp. MYb185]PRB84390.1 transporter [Pseudomonas sp. MYb185]